MPSSQLIQPSSKTRKAFLHGTMLDGTKASQLSLTNCTSFTSGKTDATLLWLLFCSTILFLMDLNSALKSPSRLFKRSFSFRRVLILCLSLSVIFVWLACCCNNNFFDSELKFLYSLKRPLVTNQCSVSLSKRSFLEAPAHKNVHLYIAKLFKSHI